MHNLVRFDVLYGRGSVHLRPDTVIAVREVEGGVGIKVTDGPEYLVVGELELVINRLGFRTKQLLEEGTWGTLPN